jgi:hypothetical protein
MAQAFEIPTGNGTEPGDALLSEGILMSSRTRFQIAAPGRHDPIRWIDNSNMGRPSARRKHANSGRMRPAAAPIPGSAIPVTLINPAGFDKTRPAARRAKSSPNPNKKPGQDGRAFDLRAVLNAIRPRRTD